jgi:hypothetical protein
MKRHFAILFIVGILNLLVFLGVFKLLQNEKVYHRTLGGISQNYERSGDWNNPEIKKVSKPYIEISNDNLLKWDASIYNCISEKMYVVEDDCYGNVRSAFFPLFPLLWRTTGSSPIGISLINYLIFILSISILVVHFLKAERQKMLMTFGILITLPSTIIYYIPYTEALFLFTMTIAALGMLKNKYWIYFIGFLLMAMVRPATIFVLMAIFATELFIFFRHKQIKTLIKSSFLKAVPFILGYFFSFLIQYQYSGSWKSFINATQAWSGKIQTFSTITDWSVEGFGMNSFAIFFVAIPATIFVVYLFFNPNGKKTFSLILPENYAQNYLLLVSVFYLTAIFIFTLATSGGNLHSFFRFTLASPFFYLAIILLINLSTNIKARNFILMFVSLSFLLILFLILTPYGGNKLQFSFVGLYLLVLSFFYIGMKHNLNKTFDTVIFSFLIFANIVWNTYLLNAFLSDSWMFT